MQLRCCIKLKTLLLLIVFVDIGCTPLVVQPNNILYRSDGTYMNDSDKLVRDIFDRYQKAANTSIESVPEPARSLMVIYSVQGVIGNGGFRYFFENDFEGYDSYNVILDAYRNIGLEAHANTIEILLKLFPEKYPQKDLKKRSEFLEKYFEVESEDCLPEVDEADNFFFNNYRLPFEKAMEYYLSNC